jgi:hypothetical protein
MAANSKSKAQDRADRIGFFRGELAALEAEDILTLSESQRVKVDNYHRSLLAALATTYDIDKTHREKQFSLGMKIASFLGALSLSAGIFFLFYQFWGRFTTATQVGILIAAPLLTLVAALAVSAREQTGYFSKLLAMVSLACFVLNLAMLGQIFNITPSDRAFLIWALFAFLLAYACDARLLVAAGIISLTCFLSARMGTWSGCYWIYFGERPENFLPAAVIIFILPLFINHRRFSGFDAIYRVFAMLVFFIPVLILANWGSASYLDMSNDHIEVLYQLGGFVFSALAIWLGIRKNWPEVVNTGNVFFVILIYTKFYDWWWDWMPKYLFFFVIGLTATAALFIFKRLRKNTVSVRTGVER